MTALGQSSAIIIFGSARVRGNTWQAICAFKGIDPIPVVDLSALHITAYDYTHQNQHDDYLPLMEKIMDYGLIILATPVYWYTMSAQMKIFIDRLTDLLKLRKDLGKRLVGKKLCVLTSYSGNVSEAFEDAFKRTCAYMHIQYLGCFHYYMGKDPTLYDHNGAVHQFKAQVLGTPCESNSSP